MKKVILEERPAVLVSEVSTAKYYGAEKGPYRGYIVYYPDYGYGFKLSDGTSFGFKEEYSLKRFLVHAGFYYSIYEFDTYQELENWETKK